MRIRAQKDSERFGKLEIVGKQNLVLKALRVLEARLNKPSVVVSGEVWAAVGKAARECNAQIFATTHSSEFIAAAHKSFRDSGIYDFRLHRLEHIEDSIKAITYDQETLEVALEIGLEVRLCQFEITRSSLLVIGQGIRKLLMR